MNVSFSSIFITLVMVTILTLFFQYIVSHKNSCRLFRSDLLIVLSFIIAVRLLLPIEYPFTFSLYLDELMNPIHTFLGYKIFNLSVSNILIYIWIIGILVNAVRFIFNIRTANTLLRNIKNISKVRNVSNFIDIDQKYNYEIWVSSVINMPMVIGISQVILLPEDKFSKSELENILLHEIQHIRYHDGYVKLFVNVLVVIYWWFIPVYYLRKLICCVLEIRADNKAAEQLNYEKIHDYALSLTRIASRVYVAKVDSKLQSSNSYFILEDNDVLKYRIQYLLESTFNRKTNKGILLCILIIPLLTNGIILEASFPYENKNDGTISDTQMADNAYIVDNKDGTYTVHINNDQVIIEDISSFIEMGVPIIER